MKKHLYFDLGIFITFACMMMISCSPVKILMTNSDPGFALSNYKTFDFYLVEADTAVLPQYAHRIVWIKEEISGYFTGRGLSQSAKNPDMLINIGIVVEEKIQTRETSIREAPVFIGQRNYSWQSKEVEVGRYNEGTVTVDLVDRQKNALMWTGVAQSIIEKKDANSKKNIAEGIPKLFAELP